MSIAIVADSFITLAQARTYLDLHDTYVERDALIGELINRAAILFKNHCGRTLKSTTWTNRLLDGTGEDLIFLPEWPVTAIASIKYADDRLFGNVDALVIQDAAGTIDSADVVVDYDTGEMRLINGDAWPVGAATVQVSFTAGFDATTGADILQAQLIQVADWYFAIGRDPSNTGWSLGGVTKKFIEGAELSPRVRGLLSRHQAPSCLR